MTELRKERGYSGEELGKKAGLTQGFISAIERGMKSPSFDTVIALAKALDTSVAYLAGETEASALTSPLGRQSQGTDAEIRSNLRPVPLDNVVWVPVVDKIVKVCAGAGNGYSADCEWEIAYKYPIVDGGIAATHDPENLLMMTVEGDSMEPDIEEGELVLFDRVDPWVPGNIVVVYYNGKLMVKGILRQGDRIVLRSRNWQEYKDIAIAEDDEFYILGRVLRIAPPLKKPKSIV